jgi:hypothetical protein
MGDDEYLAELQSGPLRAFRDWPSPDVPRHGAGVYTVWDGDALVYVGMSGRSITPATAPRATPHGLYTRLASHAAGRRSGDQFCVYVADRLVLPMLTREEVRAIAAGSGRMDAHVRDYIHARLSYRFAVVPDGATAFRLEDWVRSGGLGGRPLLNPKAPPSSRRPAKAR